MTRLSFKTTESRLRRLLAELAPDAGDRLPAERMLAMRLGCSRETLRKGLSTLEREGEAPMRYLNEGGVPNPFRIYGREGAPCVACEAAIERFRQAGRSTWWCPGCQSGRSGHPE